MRKLDGLAEQLEQARTDHLNEVAQHSLAEWRLEKALALAAAVEAYFAEYDPDWSFANPKLNSEWVEEAQAVKRTHAAFRVALRDPAPKGEANV